MKDVADKVTLITGAGMGMGKLLAKKFAENGARVILTDINADAVKTAHRELADSGYLVWEYICDVSDRAAVNKMSAWVEEEVGPLEILVNNAGVAFQGSFHEQNPDQMDTILDVNLKATIWTMRAFLPGMIERNCGHILNMASASGLMGLPGAAVYSASKWGVIGLTESVRYETLEAGKDIHFTIVCPSFVQTGMFEGAKAPLLTEFLPPEKMVDLIFRAFRKNRLYLREPFMVKTIPAFRTLLPTKAVDAMVRFFGVGKGMESFRGRPTDAN